ncbi:MAG: beta-lactamase family protein, partial [Lachnospiraceae bacterium]|nr:beta-lactamase family protein [Lachnospiraceae bacterium]
MRKEFERTSPEAVGIHSQAIMEYIDALEKSNTEMHGLMIMRHGKVCAEGWWQPFGPNLRHGLQSHTKTYAATAVGIAYTEGILKLDERLIDIFPEESPENPSENLKLLTVRDVLCMGCGMDTMPGPSKDWIRDFLHTPVNHKPGTTYMYNSTGSSMLGAIVRKKTGEGLHEYLTKRLFVKIGIDPDNVRWYCMPDGMEIGGGGMFATTEDNLRLMKLYADGGVWEGERILAEDYVRLAVTNQNDSATESINNPEASDNFLGYGFQIWMCQPQGVYRADGAMGQFTIVCPKQDMLIAINETAVGAHWAQSTLNITWDFLAKVKEEELEENPAEAECLTTRMKHLNLPNPVYCPSSPMAAKVNGKEYTVQEGRLSAEIFNFMAGTEGAAITKFRFVFDNYGFVWYTDGQKGEQEIRVAMNGCRFTNIVGK